MARIHADPFLFPDQFDRIPDSIVLIVLNKVSDVRSLGQCRAVCRRFNALIDRVVAVDGDSDDALNSSSSSSSSFSSSLKPCNFLSHILKLVILSILKPFHSLRTSNLGLKPLLPKLAHHSPNLLIELPAGDVATDDGVLLRWRAEFGSSLHSCEGEEDEEDDGSIPDSFYTNGGLKLRVVWTISSLIAASTRHYLLRQIIKEHPNLRSLVVIDAEGQGTLTMEEEQLREFRERPLEASASANRTQVPASLLKLRYASYLELPGGMAMQGATLVAIRPSPDGGAAAAAARRGGESFISRAFDGPLAAAVRALIRRRIYLLEMNSF
ncbi:unnamed protein product [Spirodela intermedia]|uniref:F-box domain-containing protein n=1 Tax=Spirodela intermedia TaxID=51605 RepID=A0A7I8JG95_SPIIN|nr:unnamed protein product [Spirodela intermedia]CAA6669180.1 unnamed protein product [Spirodela intermedia]